MSEPTWGEQSQERMFTGPEGGATGHIRQLERIAGDDQYLVRIRVMDATPVRKDQNPNEEHNPFKAGEEMEFINFAECVQWIGKNGMRWEPGEEPGGANRERRLRGE